MIIIIMVGFGCLNHKNWTIKHLRASDQYIHNEVYQINGEFSHFLTVVYAQNQLGNKRNLWNDLSNIGSTITKPWIINGDFNNVLKINDRVGGNEIQEAEYVDLEEMMDDKGLFEHDIKGQHFTWSNKHTNGLIYSQIDRDLCNSEWFINFLDCEIKILNPHI
ncbi:hypothetical protein KIW84_057961, partial [Lathyrus oleraceus]